ncbi:hypothetical protein AZF37_06695 [endosymbiont 'TC1' of Trimyema compressum]|uniref:hypothetical protein n=1 Tax=endosymbiont 'TC1' of Trimyema compressum TaxID=243899 RepID=UPI0007F10508|nr:hypothetical protein [endosymbiont 'TC1' of Trimyema compressum]AMP20890.1 hypothetical protein AZF37_06695 [endosymbiont 'TC1' of Trimyema compressum]
MTQRLNFILGKGSCQLIESIGNQCAEKIYFDCIKCWLKGKKINKYIPMSFYRTYGVFHVPSLFWIRLNYSEDSLSYYSLLSLVYHSYLKSSATESDQYFYKLLKKYKERLLTRNLDYYFFLLSHYFFQKEKYEKCLWYLEQCF